IQENPPSLCKRNPKIPPSLEKVVFQALAKHPSQRYATVSEFARAFADASPQQVLVLRDPSAFVSAGAANANNNDHTTFIPLEPPAPTNGQPVPQQPRVEVSRRAIMVGLAGLAAVGVAGSAAWAAGQTGLFSNNAATTPGVKNPTTRPSPTAQATGKLIT